ncbi:SMC-Scp complex subunit ScpB [Mycoplasma phocoenae]|uniref:Segregation and condensation protein B n=1 Tax=Mycoplasma phocoenae TaxID=754517 RepID=A0A858U6A4_9MOLU|nr:SMC-Scp complex subunit ScpB [Mycoplasma phocoenae]QJG66987.1 segregation/condensation protein B [Mycoplasma phocoenae]
MEHYTKIIEALIYVQGDDGLSASQLKEVLKLESITISRKLLKEFKEEFNKQDRGINVYEFNDIFKFLTTEEAKEVISDLVTIVKRQNLSQAAIETAGIIAYKQPVTRSMINNIRGVVSDGIVINLLTKGIIEEVGVAPTPGSPILYGITDKFYDYFKIQSLSELPPFPEFNNYNEEGNLEEDEFDLFNSQRQSEELNQIENTEEKEMIEVEYVEN